MQDNEGKIHVVITDRKIEADGIVSLVLESTDGNPLPPFDPGSHIDVFVGDDLVRQYSLCSTPSDTGRYRLGVLLEAESRGGSKAMHQLEIGQRIAISAPRNNFPLLETAGKSILVAGGIGITPLLTMAHRLHSLGADFELHYCARTRARAAFLDELLDAPFGAQVITHFDDGAPEQRFAVDQYLSDPAQDKHLYVCGPNGFMNYVTDGAAALNWRPECVHVEYFNADVDVTGDSFTIQTLRSGLTLVIPPDKPISQVLFENGIGIPLSCEQGVCGTCLTRVIEGIPDHRDLFQTDAEKATNTEMTICCSRSKSAVLVLDL